MAQKLAPGVIATAVRQSSSRWFQPDSMLRRNADATCVGVKTWMVTADEGATQPIVVRNEDPTEVGPSFGSPGGPCCVHCDQFVALDREPHCAGMANDSLIVTLVPLNVAEAPTPTP